MLILNWTVLYCVAFLWYSWLDGWKGTWPVKNWVVGCWHGCLSRVMCRFAYGPTDAIATHYFSKIQIGFTFLIPAYPGSPGQRAVKRALLLLLCCRTWLDKCPMLLAIALYTYLRVIVDHGGPIFAQLRQREVNFCVSLMRQRVNIDSVLQLFSMM